MYGNPRHLPARPLHPSAVTLSVGLFWLFTYVVLSFRAELLAGETFELVSGKRLLGTLAGALVYWLVVEWIATSWQSRPNPLVVIATILPASIAVLVARLGFDRFSGGADLLLTENLRWVLVWTGYFGTWVSIFLAYSMHREGWRSRLPAIHIAPAAVPPFASQAALWPAAKQTPAEDWEWLIDALAGEMAAAPDARPRELLQRLLDRAGYRSAETELDPAALAQNARIDLVERLARRVRRDQSLRS